MSIDRFAIALDGPSGAGKSTIAKALSEKLNILYLDSGAMYRAVGLHALRRGVSPRDADAVTALLSEIRIDVEYKDGEQLTFLLGEDVSRAIREPEVSAAASAVSAIPSVRKLLVATQQEIARGISIIMDGRDIGTHVLPGAEVKIYLNASADIRAKRRYQELLHKGASVDYETVLADMIKRDHDDMTRAASPLEKAQDAVEVITDHMDVDQVVAEILRIVELKRREAN